MPMTLGSVLVSHTKPFRSCWYDRIMGKSLNEQPVEGIAEALLRKPVSSDCCPPRDQ